VIDYNKLPDGPVHLGLEVHDDLVIIETADQVDALLASLRSLVAKDEYGLQPDEGCT